MNLSWPNAKPSIAFVHNKGFSRLECDAEGGRPRCRVDRCSCDDRILLSAPDGAIVFNEQFDKRVNRIDPGAVENPAACLALDANGRNPCIRDLLVGGGDLRREMIHSIAFDRAGRLGFSECLDIDYRDAADTDVVDRIRRAGLE